jgi:predicted alpha/beta hydrolase family esterase
VRRAAAVLALGLTLAGCGSPPATEVLGSGAAQVTIRRPAHPHGATVLFLHGWGAVAPSSYENWIRHLVREGHVVVYPRYQTSFVSAPAEALPNALRGIRTAFEHVEVRHLVVVGHSAGGALAADYAAVARTARLPSPSAILLAYPGRAARGLPGRLPELGDQRIPRAVRIVALASRGDRVVGTTTAREIVRGAGHGQLVLVDTPGATHHLAPQRDAPVSRRVFWDRLDGLLKTAG